ncbi:MAG: hypothetical protein QXM22_01155 [Candidatus Bathyarchaeia archaeon]
MANINTEDEKIEALIQRAIRIVEKVREPYRMKAFEVVLSNLLVSPLFERKEKQKETKGAEGTLDERIAEFAAECKLTVEQLKSVFEFQQDKPIFIVPRQVGSTHAQNQVLVSRYLLAAYGEIYGKEWVSLVPVLTDHGVGSLANLAVNLKRHPTVFNIKGQGKGTEYKLVEAAKHETFNMIHNLVE